MIYSVFLAVSLLFPFASILAQTTPRVLSPVEAVIGAAEAATTSRRVLRGVFEMQVRAAGRQDSLLYLNSETDYRDQRSLTIAITPAVERALREKFGSNIEGQFVGKRIRVTGSAQRITIWFSCYGKKTDKYYYQTHVPVFNLEQLTVLDSSGK
jgi:hypothetical protein